MELWIRSQSKEMLVKVEKIVLIEGISSDWYLGDGGCILGIYKSKERALEVLDEIQSKLTSNKSIMQLDRTTHIRQEDVDRFYNNYNIKLLPAWAHLKSIPNDIVIYEMPKE